MSGDEILKKLQKLMDAFATKGTTVSVRVTPYKTDVFRLFEQAYDGDYFSKDAKPLLTGDAIRGLLRAQWLQKFSADERNNAEKVMEDVLRSWDEWRFAWDQRRD
jgi:hypothetical protein